MSVDWDGLIERQTARYVDGLTTLPEDADARQKQLVRVANAALGCGLALLMTGRGVDARRWLLDAAVHYRESWEDAPAGSWGRLIGAVKMRLIAEDARGVELDARWAMRQEPDRAESPIGRYAATLALLALGDDAAAAPVADGLVADGAERFPADVAEALAGLAHGDAERYAAGVRGVVASFEQRDAYLEDVPIADTALVLELLAGPRGLAQRPASALLPSA
ncbi:MAG: hypothetical protein R3C15_22785 [Thermoleophilia bacterium]